MFPIDLYLHSSIPITLQTGNMATVKFILQQPYKATKKKDETTTTPKGEGAANGLKRGKILNPQETRLYMFLIIDREHVVKVKTEHTMLPKEWDFKKQGKHEKIAGAIEFNAKLAALKLTMLTKYAEIIDKHPDITFPELSDQLKEYGKRQEIPILDNDKSFFDVLDLFIKSLEGEVTPGTVKKFNTLKKTLIMFTEDSRKYPIISFSNIDHNFYDAFTGFLRKMKPRGRQLTRPEGMQEGLLNDTIGKYIETLKTFLTWAEERNYNRNQTYKQFTNFSKANRKRKATKTNDIVTLSLSELKQFYSHDFSARPALERVRDVFCFAAFTGQRWSDIERLDKNDIHGDVWCFNAYKTKKMQEIDLAGYAAPALEILKKYHYKLPMIALQKFNEALKTAGEIAEINTPVKIRRYVGAKEIEMTKPKYKFMSTHMARKTCVSILLNNYNINPTHVLEITGHSDLKTLQKYINKDRQARREAITATKSITETLTVVKDVAV